MNGNDTGLSLAEWTILILLLVVGLGYAIWSALIGMAQGQEQLTAFTVPGEVRFVIERPGSYVIYNEVQRSADSQDTIRPPGLNQIRLNVQHVATGARIELEEARNEASFVIRRTRAESLYRFHAEEGGEYVALGHYEDPGQSGDFRFIVAQDFQQQIFDGLSRAALATFVTIIAVTALAYRAMRRGREESPA